MEPQENNTSDEHSIDFIDQFVEGLDSDHLIELIRGAPPQPCSTTSTITDPIFHTFDFAPTPGELFDLGSNRSSVFDDPGLILNSLSGIEDDIKDYDDDDEDETDHSSATATTPTSGSKKPKLDRARTLISERKRRGRMKEKLYALRALVPNITKMDKASIVGDAVLYLQDLQMQAKKLKSDIAQLESSLKNDNRGRGFVHGYKKNTNAPILAPAPKIITQIDVFRVEEREFYVRLRSNKGQGVAVSLYKALESLSNTTIRNSNLSTVFDRFILAFTVQVGGESLEDLDLPSMKMWISRAFVNHGFQLETT